MDTPTHSYLLRPSIESEYAVERLARDSPLSSAKWQWEEARCCTWRIEVWLTGVEDH